MNKNKILLSLSCSIPIIYSTIWKVIDTQQDSSVVMGTMSIRSYSLALLNISMIPGLVIVLIWVFLQKKNTKKTFFTGLFLVTLNTIGIGISHELVFDSMGYAINKSLNIFVWIAIVYIILQLILHKRKG